MMVPCECGCGEDLFPFDENGRYRRFIYCHKPLGEASDNWKGGRRPDSSGYELIYLPSHPHCTKKKEIRVHRLVMEKHLGRYLTKDEVVHHIDGNKKNNDISNLKLIENNGKHLKDNHTLDMTNRYCITCKSTKTYIMKNGRPLWLKHPTILDLYECTKCHEKRRIRNRRKHHT